jgi:hypothetical protein
MLVFAAAFFERKRGTYNFCYANSHFVSPDYEEIPLFTVSKEKGLKGLFQLDKKQPLYTVYHRSHFTAETSESERKRWEAFVPTEVLDRNRGLENAWWVE